MAEIKNYTRGLDFAGAKAACAEVQRSSLSAKMVVYG
jgi:hypothetical protein